MNQQQHDQLRSQFPALAQEVNGHPLVYLDNAATTQKPQAVLDAIAHYYRVDNANVHRAAHVLSGRATRAFETARETVARFINAPRSHEVIWTRGTTEAINLVAQSWGMSELKAGDEIILSTLEHHANIVPWQILQQERGIELRWVPLTSDFQLDLSSLPTLLAGAKVFSFTAMSNVLGTINPVEKLCSAAHAAGAIAIVDACQSVPHTPTDVQALGADFAMFSSHKMCGPSGLGVLWGREALLEAMPPFMGGGNMISEVRLDGFKCAELPAKFEAGTPAIVEVVGLGAAVEFLNSVGMANIRQHEIALSSYVLEMLTSRFGDDITIHGPCNPELRGSTFSFAFRGIHPHDLSQVLDQSNVCVRAGHHCAKPLMKIIGANATARASFYLYNTTTDADKLADALDSASDIF